MTSAITPSAITLVEAGTSIDFSFDDLMKYHGPGFPGGVAHAFVVLARALPLLDGGARVERRDVSIRTAFRGPGARDAFEMATRAVTGDRYEVTEELEQPERGEVLMRYVFELSYRGTVCTLQLKDDGLVTEEFIALSRQTDRSAAENAHLEQLKREMRDRLLSRAPEDVYDAMVAVSA